MEEQSRRKSRFMRHVGFAVMRWVVALGGGAMGVPAAPKVAFSQGFAQAWFGVELGARKDEKPGVVARHVIRTSPADKAGIKDGDVILKVAGHDVSAPSEVIASVRARKPTDAVEVVLERGGRVSSAHVVLGVFPSSDEMLRIDKIGTFAPTLSGVQTVQGQGVDNPSLLRGRVVVLDFWASWCGVCRLVSPVLNGWQSKFGAQGLVVVGVSSDTPAIASKATQAFGIHYAVGTDRNENVFSAYGVQALPTMFVLDKQGVIREVEVGLDPSHLSHIEGVIQRLLSEQAPNP